jgi:hypothetical protein
MEHPTLPRLTPAETAMECPQIDLAIDRADTVRWLIRDDHGSLETARQRNARYAANVIVIPIAVLLHMPGYHIGSAHHALEAADNRIRELLRLKRARGCPPRITAHPGVHDLALLDEVELVQAKIDTSSGDEEALFEERSRLLDGLRLVPVPSAGSNAPPLKDNQGAGTK